MVKDLALKKLNNLLADFFPMVATRQPKYRYYRDERNNRYFWTIERTICQHGSDKHYLAGVYRYYKGKKMWKLVKKRCFAKKWRAKEWAGQKWKKSHEKEMARKKSME